MDDSVNSPRIPGYASVKEAAEMLGLSPRTVYDYIEEGRLPTAVGKNLEPSDTLKGEPRSKPAPQGGSQ